MMMLDDKNTMRMARRKVYGLRRQAETTQEEPRRRARPYTQAHTRPRPATAQHAGRKGRAASTGFSTGDGAKEWRRGKKPAREKKQRVRTIGSRKSYVFLRTSENNLSIVRRWRIKIKTIGDYFLIFPQKIKMEKKNREQLQMLLQYCDYINLQVQ